MAPDGPGSEGTGVLFERARRRLVDSLVRDGTIRTRRLAAAFRAVPRELFVPPGAPDTIYSDTTIPVAGTGGAWLTTSSQPAMMALMLEQLQATPGERVLEIGTGTGYNAAVLSVLVGPSGTVHSVEIECEAAEGAAAALRRAGCSAHVHQADGAEGWPPDAPYDKLLATVAVWDVPVAWLAQLAPGGRIVAPLSVIGGEYSMALEREGEAWVSRSLEPCAFVRFKGRLSHPDTRLALGEEGHPVLILTSEPAQLPAPRDVHGWLQSGHGHLVETFEAGEWDGFMLHLLFHNGPSNLLRAQSTGLGLGWQGTAAGLWDNAGFAVVTTSGRLEHFGAGAAADTMMGHLAAWRSAGRPDLRHFRFRLAPEATAPGPGRLPRWRHTLRVEPFPR